MIVRASPPRPPRTADQRVLDAWAAEWAPAFDGRLLARLTFLAWLHRYNRCEVRR